MKPIRIEVWKRTDVRHWTCVQTLQAGSWSKARKLAQKAMGPVVTTDGCYHRDMGRAPWVKLIRRSKHRTGPGANNVTPEVHFVPSVGELGYW
jgi:hypothetical protein